MKKIHIFWPTVRPDMAAARARLWIERSRNGLESANFRIFFGVERGLDTAPLRSIGFAHATILQVDSPCTGVCHPVTMMTRGFDIPDDDAVILASDDFEPSPAQGAGPTWDEQVLGFFAENQKGCLLDDGYKTGFNIVAIPVLSGKILRRLNGVVYNPAYHHFFSDQELHDILSGMGEICNRRDAGRLASPLFVHKHYSHGGLRARDQHDHNNDGNWSADKTLYETRKHWTTEDKLKLPKDWPSDSRYGDAAFRAKYARPSFIVRTPTPPPAGTKLSPLYFCYWAHDPSYKSLAEACSASFAKFDVPVTTQELASKGNWMSNCMLRAMAIHTEASANPDRTIVLFDSDLTCVADPVLLKTFDVAAGDIAVHDKGGLCVGGPSCRYCPGILAIAPTLAGRRFLARWAELCVIDPTPREFIREQFYFNQAIQESHKLEGGIRILNLGWAYNHVEARRPGDPLASPEKNPVILHHVASRTLREKVGGSL